MLQIYFNPTRSNVTIVVWNVNERNTCRCTCEISPFKSLIFFLTFCALNFWKLWPDQREDCMTGILKLNMHIDKYNVGIHRCFMACAFVSDGFGIIAINKLFEKKECIKCYYMESVLRNTTRAHKRTQEDNKRKKTDPNGNSCHL